MRAIVQAIPAFRRVQLGVVLLATLVVVGTLGYVILGRLIYDENWGYLDCLFMTIITITTIGYGDVLRVHEGGHTGALIYTMLVAVVGMGVSLYVVSVATAFIVEGDLQRVLWSRRMSKRIEKLSNHFIVCGVGETGKHVAEELLQTGRPFVAVDMSEEHIERLQAHAGQEIPAVLGDATDDDVLLAAGIRQASGLVAALPSDKDNLFLTITARHLNPALRIVSKAIDDKTRGKLVQAGADSVVSPNTIGGLRMVSELVRPETVSFLDQMLRDKKGSFRFEDLHIKAGGSAAGKTLRELDLAKRFKILAVAARQGEGEQFRYCLDSDIQLDDETILVVLGEAENVDRARKELG